MEQARNRLAGRRRAEARGRRWRRARRGVEIYRVAVWLRLVLLSALVFGGALAAGLDSGWWGLAFSVRPMAGLACWVMCGLAALELYGLFGVGAISEKGEVDWLSLLASVSLLVWVLFELLGEGVGRPGAELFGYVFTFVMLTFPTLSAFNILSRLMRRRVVSLHGYDFVGEVFWEPPAERIRELEELRVRFARLPWVVAGLAIVLLASYPYVLVPLWEARSELLRGVFFIYGLGAIVQAWFFRQVVSAVRPLLWEEERRRLLAPRQERHPPLGGEVG